MDSTAGFEGLRDIGFVQEGDREGGYYYSTRHHQSNDAEDKQQARRTRNRLDVELDCASEHATILCFDGAWELKAQQDSERDRRRHDDMLLVLLIVNGTIQVINI